MCDFQIWYALSMQQINGLVSEDLGMPKIKNIVKLSTLDIIRHIYEWIPKKLVFQTVEVTKQCIQLFFFFFFFL